MDQDTLKKSVNLNLRCVTQSCKGGVPLNRLEKDYKDLIGKPIPVNDLGFNSIELFLRSIPDVVCLKRNSDGQIIVEGVADASTQHIANLISRQKNSKAKKGTSKKPSLPIRKYSYSWKSSASNPAGVHKQVNKASVSPPVKLKMPAWNTSNTGLINSDSNTEATSRSFTELPSVLNNSQKLTSSKKETSVPSNSLLDDKEISKVSNKASVPVPNVAKCSDSNAQTAEQRRQCAKLRRAAKALIRTSKLSVPNPELSKKVYKAHMLKMTMAEFLEWVAESSSNQDPAEQKSKSLISRNIWILIFPFKGGIRLSQLNAKYAFQFGEHIPYQDLGYGSLKAFITDIPNLIHLKKEGIGSEYTVEAVRKTTLQTPSIASQQKEVPSTSNESINYLSQSGWETSSNCSSTTSTIPPAPDLKISVPPVLESATIASIPPSPVIKTKSVLPSFSQATSSESKSPVTLTSFKTLTENQDPAKGTEQLSKKKQKKLKSLTSRNLWNVVFRFEDGIQLSQLATQYLTLYGKPIPYKDLGYKTLKAFIQDIPDVLHLKKGEKVHEYAAEAVRDTSSQASSITSQQKKNTSNFSPSENQGSPSDWEISSNSSSNISNVVPAPDVSIENSLKNIQSVLSTYNVIESIIPPPVATTKPVLPAFSQAVSSESVSSINSNLSKLEYKPTLNNFPEIKHSIESTQFNSLLLMNILLYGDDSFLAILKRGILAFDGFPFSEDSDGWKQKQLLLSMLPEDTLKECLKLLCIECDTNNKQVLIHKLMQFLSSPSKAISERK